MATTYSKYFSLAELTRTDTGITNKPTASDLPKLLKLGKTLDTIYEKIGPFKIISGYRSPTVQAALKSGGNVQAVSKSYHSTGQAADIMPTSQNVQEFFAKITATPAVRNMLGGYAIKTNVIHFDTNTAARVGVPMWVDKAGNYIRFTASELTNLLKKHKTVAVAGGGLIILLAAGAAAFIIMNRGKK